MPNAENCTLEELETAANATPSRRSYVRMMAIKAIILGVSHEQVALLFAVNRDSVSRGVRWFNQRGIDGLIERPHTGRPPKIDTEAGKRYQEVVLHPEKVNETLKATEKHEVNDDNGSNPDAFMQRYRIQ